MNFEIKGQNNNFLYTEKKFSIQNGRIIFEFIFMLAVFNYVICLYVIAESIFGY